jgi:hypothetical protein
VIGALRPGRRGRIALGVTIAAALVLRASAAHAVFGWVLEDWVFDDGGTATGTLTTDAEGEPLAWSIDVSGGNETDFPQLTYSDANGGMGNLTQALLYTLIQNSGLPSERQLMFAMTFDLNAYGTVDVDVSTMPMLSFESCSTCTPTSRSLVSGTLTAPEPESAASAALAALALLAATRRGWSRPARGRRRPAAHGSGAPSRR